MRDTYLLLDGQQTGPFSEEQLRDILSQNQATIETLAWHEGLEDWVLLGSLIQVAPIPPTISRTQHVLHATPPAFQQHIAKPTLSQPAEIQTNVKQGALLGGTVCLVLGLGLMYLTLFSFFIYGPLFLAAFILSIVAMAQRRIFTGVVLLVLTLVVPVIFGFSLFAFRAAEALGVKESTTTQSETNPPSKTGSESKSSITTTQYPALDEKEGFRSYKLGTQLSQLNQDDLETGTFIIPDPDKKIFFVKNFNNKIGNAQIDTIRLIFAQDLLKEIIITTKGEQSGLGLKEALITAYGQPKDEVSFTGGRYDWEGNDCVLEWNKDIEGNASATFTSKKVDSTIKQLTEDKAKSGAADGAKNL